MKEQRTISDEPKWHDCHWGGLLEDLMDRGEVSRGEARLMLGALQKRRIWRDCAFWALMLPVFFGWMEAVAAMRRATGWMSRDVEEAGPADWIALFLLGLVAPFVLMMVVGFVPWWLQRREARRLAATPACFACTYDLSGAPADAPHVCTECGFTAPHMRSRASDGVSDAPVIHSPATEQPPSHPP